MDDELDFIANIEQTAPAHEEEIEAHRCQECGTPLNEVDGEFVCPNCHAKAINILQLEASEMHYDENGRPILGQRVKQTPRARKHTTDYGWAWSTDEAIVHILNLQLNALEDSNVVPTGDFRRAVKNMWFKYWLINVAPYIKDEYNEQDLVPVLSNKSLKYRDIQVLVKLADKVMIPSRELQLKKRNQPQRAFRMLGARFLRHSRSRTRSRSKTPPICTIGASPTKMCSEDSADDHESMRGARRATLAGDVEMEPITEDEVWPEGEPHANPVDKNGLTRNIGKDSVSILTLNRTLAFLEAAARLLNMPIFASDIIRACNQRIIPFFGAHNTLPEGILLNNKDKLMFQKTRPPTPHQLIRTTCHLIRNVYHEELPFYLPVPEIKVIFERFCVDLNLPPSLLDLFDSRVNFSAFRQTLPKLYRSRHETISYLPHYDRWAFSIFLSQIKELFNLGEPSLLEQAALAKRRRRSMMDQTQAKPLVISDWVRQLSLRFKLVMSYDPFTLFHPMANVTNIEPTPQVYKYVETLIDERAVSTSRRLPTDSRFDRSHRAELSDFLSRQLTPRSVSASSDAECLESVKSALYPLTDALERTRRFWESDLEGDCRELWYNFAQRSEIVLPERAHWMLYDEQDLRGPLRDQVKPDWPYAYKLLLHVGAFMCYCLPQQMLRSVLAVEELIHPELVALKRREQNIRRATGERRRSRAPRSRRFNSAAAALTQRPRPTHQPTNDRVARTRSGRS